MQALPLGQTGPYARALSASLTLLDGERLAGRGQLAGATTPGEESRAGHVLKSGFAGVAERLAAVTPTPFARPAHVALVAALRNAGAQYGWLAHAAATHDGRAYTAAAQRVEAAERRVDAGISRLERIRLP